MRGGACGGHVTRAGRAALRSTWAAPWAARSGWTEEQLPVLWAQLAARTLFQSVSPGFLYLHVPERVALEDITRSAQQECCQGTSPAYSSCMARG